MKRNMRCEEKSSSSSPPTTRRGYRSRDGGSDSEETKQEEVQCSDAHSGLFHNEGEPADVDATKRVEVFDVEEPANRTSDAAPTTRGKHCLIPPAIHVTPRVSHGEDQGNIDAVHSEQAAAPRRSWTSHSVDDEVSEGERGPPTLIPTATYVVQEEIVEAQVMVTDDTASEIPAIGNRLPEEDTKDGSPARRRRLVIIAVVIVAAVVVTLAATGQFSGEDMSSSISQVSVASENVLTTTSIPLVQLPTTPKEGDSGGKETTALPAAAANTTKPNEQATTASTNASVSSATTVSPLFTRTSASSPYPPGCDAVQCWNQIGYTLKGDYKNDDFGYFPFIDATGDRFVVTARLDPTGGDRAGAVRVYDVNSGGTISPVGGTFLGVTEEEIRATISGDGKRVAIGAPYYGESGTDIQFIGRVMVYELRSGIWTQLGDTIYGENKNDRAGYSVALSYNGETVAFGCIHANERRGEVRVHQLIDGIWKNLGESIVGAGVFDKSGWTVALSDDGDVVAIGSKNNDNAGFASGHFRVFQFRAGEWVKRGNDIEGEQKADSCGMFVSLASDGNAVASSSSLSDLNGPDSGHVRVFSFDGGNWVQKGKSIAGDGPYAQLRMSSLSADGSRVAVGSGAQNHVAVHDYDDDIRDWVQVGGRIGGKTNEMGFGGFLFLSASGTRLLVSGKEGPAEDYTGFVRMYELQEL